EHLTRVLASAAPRSAPSRDTVAVLLGTPGAVPYMPGVTGPLLRQVPGLRSLSLSLLSATVERSPLDVSRVHQLTHEWYTGTRWAALPTTELGGALRQEVLVQQRTETTCARALSEGALAYAPIAGREVALAVPDTLAPPHGLHRFHLVALREGAPHLSWA